MKGPASHPVKHFARFTIQRFRRMERLVGGSVGWLVHKSRLKISRYTKGERESDGGREEGGNEVSGNCTANGLNKGRPPR